MNNPTCDKCHKPTPMVWHIMLVDNRDEEAYDWEGGPVFCAECYDALAGHLHLVKREVIH